MTDAEHKAGLRTLLDGSWSAIFEAIGDAVEDVADADPICSTIRDLVTAERALGDGAVRDPPTEEKFAELVRAIRERRGR